MAFTEETKLAVKRKSHFMCCLCHALGIEIHHIVPQAEGGEDTDDNAAPLCPSCHETYGANSVKRKFIREARDFWYELCEQRYAADPKYLDGLKRVEDGLAEIQKDVRAIHSPLLPCGLFVTLRFEATDSDLELLFKEEVGYRAVSPNSPMPPPPIGLPPGMTEGRVVQKDRYLEYTNGVLSAAGFYNLEHPGYNVIHGTVSHTISSLPRQSISHATEQNNPLLGLQSAKVEFYFDQQTAGVNPSLVLESVLKGHETPSARALDNSVFVDHAMFLVPEPADQPQRWNITDLKGAHIRVTLLFFYLEPISALPKESWPTMHNLQIWLGPKAEKLLSFSLEQLSTQVVREDPQPMVFGQAKCVQVLFECDVNETVYAKSLLSAR
ncbi:MAG: HNH endonuclease signature motif containing protein [Candidatus Contendobacter sp.]|nr:HNH endonuclease signature motif containing protein [Candidatus Contendobacter sp.]